MKNKTLWMRCGGVLGLILLATAPSTCDSSNQQQDMQEELRRQNAARIQAEQAARDAEESRRTWIALLSCGACTLSLVVLLIGVSIGSRAVRRYRKEHPRE